MKIRTALSFISRDRKRRRGRALLPLTPTAREHLFFREGWGDEAVLLACSRYSLANEPRPIEIEWKKRPWSDGDSYDGTFQSPVDEIWLPEKSRTAHARLLLPKGKRVGEIPLCICFPMTGDEGYSIRTRTFAAPLIKKGMGVLLLTNPYYARRRPEDQKNYFLSRVHDMLVMCLTAVQEGKSLVRWASEQGSSPLGVAGVSQGGMIAGVVASLSSRPLAAALALAAHSPDVIFNEGLLRSFVDWPALGDDPNEVADRLQRLFAVGDLRKLPTPKAPHATFLLGAKRDLVVPRYSVKEIHAAWKGSQLQWLPGTHLTSIGLHEKSFRNLVLKAFAKLEGR